MMLVLVAIMVPLTMSDFVGRLSGNGAAGRRTCREKPRLMFMMLGPGVRIGWEQLRLLPMMFALGGTLAVSSSCS